MIQSIDQTLVIQFSEMCHLKAQQMTSHLKGKVEEQYINHHDSNKFMYEFFEHISTRRDPNNTVIESIYQNIYRSNEIKKIPVISFDNFDDLRILIDPSKDYASAVVRSMMIEYDRVCLEAALGSVNTGRRLSNTLTAAQDGVYTEPENASGLTFDKISNIMNRFSDNGIGVEFEEKIYLCITSTQYSDLVKEYRLSSTGCGRRINIIILPKYLIQKTGNTRHCIAFSESAICVGIKKDLDTEFNKNSIHISMSMAALRTKGTKVIQVDCLETV